MRAQRIEQDATGTWEISTFAGSLHVLCIPLDGRATVARYTDWGGVDPSAGPAELPEDGREHTLVAWCSFDPVGRVGPAIELGSCMVLLVEPIDRDGVLRAVISTPVVAIYGEPAEPSVRT
ncbi:hypothetical protein [Cellulomonas rhizosphaerae]|uniref:Uncharacterized protein n=1 Tax=Cellulomonas rhizosphaerae TaxID=2293719 RepID=A0A413RP47_9CELL|nr:hypothetical protein [Cellulomonas rhizosphaerae]RHA43782.1 hypothetical protein D1825_04585 [Cellulomonas rhizosphaerae]